jgi:cyclophilin family peptidyl-prolyl cis-trans isomerase/HEAT repeat protein
MKRSSLFCAGLLVVALSNGVMAQQNRPRARNPAALVPSTILLRIIRAEDERRCDDGLLALLADANAKVRRRAALAAGRIGDERAVPVLAEMLLTDREPDVRQMAAFALGEIESPGGAFALLSVLKEPGRAGRAQAVEALGKVTAALASSAPTPNDRSASTNIEDERLGVFKIAILDVLRFEAERRSAPDRLTILLGLTAALRAKPEDAGPVIAKFLSYSDPRIRADALNTLSRLKLKEGNEQARKLLTADPDPTVRANTARVLGATQDKAAFDALVDRARRDPDLRVRVSAIRALGTLKDARAAEQLLQRGNALISSERVFQSSKSELLEIAATLGGLLPNAANEAAIAFLRKMHNLTKGEAVEVELAFARIAPGVFANDLFKAEVAKKSVSWRKVSARAQGLAALKSVVVGSATGSAGESALRGAEEQLRAILSSPPPTYAVPEVLRAYASYKPKDLKPVLLKHLGVMNDVSVRATAAELLGEVSLDDKDIKALADEFYLEITPDESYAEPDAAIAILETLAKQKSARAYEEIKKGFLAKHYVIRRRAAALLKESGVGDFFSEVGPVDTYLREPDYRRAIGRIGKQVRAMVATNKGSFVIQFLPDDAPLTVDNFVQLARKGYFNGQTIPRVVPNFVVQAGDPRGDQNGGPGYQIRCELNEAPFERGTVGMALSGKDTGGSQWFVTHSPQPHLDGGYTVFGRVVSGMEVVDRIARGDIIRRVAVSERP